MNLPRDIHTGIYDAEAAELERLATDQRVIEFGTWHGFSAVVMGRVAEQVVTVDWHHGDPQAGIQETLPIHIDALTRYGLRDWVVTIVGKFDQVGPTLSRDYFTVGFLDGLHDLEPVTRDLNLMASLLDRPGCVLACHDYNRSLGGTPFEVTPAVDAFLKANKAWKKAGLTESLFVMEHR